MYNLIITTIKDLIKSPVFLSTITALCTWWVKNKNVKFKNRRVELYRLIRINYYYQNEINGDHVTLNGKCGLAPPNNRFERTHGTSPFAAQPNVRCTPAAGQNNK